MGLIFRVNSSLPAAFWKTPRGKTASVGSEILESLSGVISGLEPSAQSRFLPQLRSLRGERDEAFLLENLVQVGVQLKSSGQEAAAAFLLERLSRDDILPEICERAKLEHAGLVGAKHPGMRVEYFLSRLADDHTALKAIFPMLGTTLVGQGVGAILFGGLSRTAVGGILGGVLRKKLAATVGALALEIPTLVGLNHLFSVSGGGDLGDEFLRTGMALGVFRGVGGVRQFIAARRPLAAGINELMHSSTTFAGLLGVHQLEGHYGLRPVLENETAVVDTLYSWFTMALGSQGGRAMMGRFQFPLPLWERGRGVTPHPAFGHLLPANGAVRGPQGEKAIQHRSHVTFRDSLHPVWKVSKLVDPSGGSEYPKGTAAPLSPTDRSFIEASLRKYDDPAASPALVEPFRKAYRVILEAVRNGEIPIAAAHLELLSLLQASFIEKVRSMGAEVSQRSLSAFVADFSAPNFGDLTPLWLEIYLKADPRRWNLTVTDLTIPKNLRGHPVHKQASVTVAEVSLKFLEKAMKLPSETLTTLGSRGTLSLLPPELLLRSPHLMYGSDAVKVKFTHEISSAEEIVKNRSQDARHLLLTDQTCTIEGVPGTDPFPAFLHDLSDVLEMSELSPESRMDGFRVYRAMQALPAAWREKYDSAIAFASATVIENALEVSKIFHGLHVGIQGVGNQLQRERFVQALHEQLKIQFTRRHRRRETILRTFQKIFRP